MKRLDHVSVSNFEKNKESKNSTKFKAFNFDKKTA